MSENPSTENNPIGLYVSIAVAVAIIAGLLWLLLSPSAEPDINNRTSQPLPTPAVAPSPPEPQVIAKPVVEEQTPAIEVSEDPLPELDQSDLPVRFAVGDLFQSETLNDWLIADQLLRRFVVIVDNLADGKLVYKHHVIPAPEGSFRTRKAGDTVLLDQKNYQRYEPYVSLLDSLDPELAAGMYTKFLPLLEDAYRELGYPNRRFEERMRQAINLVAQTNIVDMGEIELIQPSVHYRYAKDELESLNAVHKLLLRLGPKNSAIVQKKLKAISVYL